MLTKVVGMDKKLVTCHIVRINCSIQANYGALRGNDLQADFVRKLYLHEIVYIMEGLREHYSQDKTVETVMRYGKLLEFGHDDLTALKKLCSWPSASLSKLISILKLFESFQTEDAKYLAKRQSSKLMKGSTMPVPHNLFRKVGKMSAKYIDEVADKIIGRQLSLKQAAENFGKISSRSVTMTSVVKELAGSGYQTEQEVLRAFPTKFSAEVLDSFSGSVIGEKGMNKKGEALKDYCRGVAANEGNTPKASFKTVDNFINIEFSTLSEFDTVVINCRNLTEGQVQQLKALKAASISTNIILLFSGQDEKMEIFSKLDSDLPNLKEIFFETEQPIRKGEFCQNLKHGLISSPIVFKPPLKCFNGPISNLENVVDQISPPGGKSVFINEESLIITAIHSNFSCEYYGEKNALDHFDKKLRSGSGVVKDVTISESNCNETLPNENNSGTKTFEVTKAGMEEPGGDFASSLNDSAIAGCSSWSQNLDKIAEGLSDKED